MEDEEGEEEEEEDPVLFECVATYGYTGQYEDELSFQTGDRVDVTADSKRIPYMWWWLLSLMLLCLQLMMTGMRGAVME